MFWLQTHFSFMLILNKALELKRHLNIRETHIVKEFETFFFCPTFWSTSSDQQHTTTIGVFFYFYFIKYRQSLLP